MKAYLGKSATLDTTAVAERCPMRREDFDPFDLSDPFPSYQRLRAETPVFYDETIGYWIVSRYADIKAVFEDWRSFSSENAQAPMRPLCHTSQAYAACLAADGLDRRLESLLGWLRPTDLRAVQAVSAEIRSAILKQILPPDVEAAIRVAFGRLAADCGGEVPVAVRSSATAEDMPDASFAGQQDTYLWVCGIDAVLHGVRRCWASLFNARAIIYRANHGIAHRDVFMAVGVQKMVNARVAGVAMTLDPGNGDRSKIVVDASWGIGELVVSGEITPDNYVVDKVMLTPVRCCIAEKPEMLLADREAGRLMRIVVPSAQRAVPCLTPDELITVARLAKAAERYYGTPQDIEWAIDPDLPARENVVLLQSRPETVWRRKSRPAPAGGARGHGVSSIAATLIAFKPLPPVVPIEDVRGGVGLDPTFELLANYDRAIQGAYRQWQYHFEFLNLGYAAYLDFFNYCKQAFPDIPDQAIAKMVQGIETDLFRPDEQLKALAKQAIELGIAEEISQGSVQSLFGRLRASEAGRRWLVAWEKAQEPWFNFTSGNGFYASDKYWADHPEIPLGYVRNYMVRLLRGDTIDRDLAALRAERDRITEEYATSLEKEARAVFEGKLGLARQVYPYVENHNFYIEHWSMGIFWRKMRELSRVLQREADLERLTDSC